MFSVLLLSALLRLVAAVPSPQLIDTKAVEAVSDPVIVSPPYDDSSEKWTNDESTIASQSQSHKLDGDCAPQPAGSGPVSTPDTPDAFLSNPTFPELAKNATTPDGYSLVMQNTGASLSASKYMGLTTLKSYDTWKCASLCNKASGCQAFNLYVERDPSLDPNRTNCPNPPSLTNFKCTLWGAPVSAVQAKNKGQWRDSFQVIIAGSNAYNKVSPPPEIGCFTGPVELEGAINAPRNAQGRNTYMGYSSHPFSQTQGYDPATCAKDCLAKTAYNQRHPAADGSYQSCVFFNAYVLSQNGVPQGIFCSMYSQVWSPAYATNYGQYRGSDKYTVSRSYSYSLILPHDGGSGSCSSSSTTKTTATKSSTTSTATTTSSTSQTSTTSSTSTTTTTTPSSSSTTTTHSTSTTSTTGSTSSTSTTSPPSSTTTPCSTLYH